jgi:hypothetical protein
MLVKKVKLDKVFGPVAFQKKDKSNTPLKTPEGQDVIGYRWQAIFSSLDYKKDSIPITMFTDNQEFPFSVGLSGELQFLCEAKEKTNPQEGEFRYYPDFKIINFMPV